MIESGEKKEEYRTHSDYWIKGLLMENITAVMTSIDISRLRTFVSTLDTLIQR